MEVPGFWRQNPKGVSSEEVTVSPWAMQPTVRKSKPRAAARCVGGSPKACQPECTARGGGWLPPPTLSFSFLFLLLLLAFGLFVYFFIGIYFEKEQWSGISSNSGINFISFSFLSLVGPWRAVKLLPLLINPSAPEFPTCKIKGFNSVIPSKGIGFYYLSNRGFLVPT